MFIPTMSDAEIQQEARKDFFELSTKVQLAADRFMRINCDLTNKSRYQHNDRPISLISKTVENRKWKTRRHNIWTSCFRFKNGIVGANLEMICFLYTPVYRANGTEYIFQGSTKDPIAERFTMHFIERYKERHLKPRNINIGAMPVPLYFQIHNPNCILGRYYKTSDIDIAEGKHKRFWIAPEGIYVTDYIEGMLTYITFMDKDNLSPLKKQVYEEEVVWDLMLRLVNKRLSSDERTKAAFSIANNPDLEIIFERFAKRNIKDEADGEKQKTLSYAKEQMALIKDIINNTKRMDDQKKKIKDRENLINRAFDPCNLIDDEPH